MVEQKYREQLLKQSQFELVLSKSQRLLQLLPSDEDALLSLAKATRAQGKHADAADMCRRLVEQHPENWSGHVLLGQINLSQGQLLEADECFRAASMLYDGDVSLFYGWGKTLGLLGLHELAIEKFEKASELDPYDGDTYEAWGATLKILGRFQEAAEVFKRASEYM